MTGQSLTDGLARMADRLNPILIKETRQALKSRQFSGTFLLLLAASLVVSFGGVALVGPDIAYRAAGDVFFLAYFAVLAFAIFVVTPFGAYRSLAAEQEERTYELLSITTLKPSQIVVGKLLSAMIQMFIYYSAIVPFMAFTYLLKGIDILSILFILVMALLASLAFSLIGLLLATFSTRRSWQVLLSVVMIIGLGFVTIVSVPAAAETLEEIGGIMRDPEFLVAMAAVATAYITTFALVLQLCVSQLTFESDNRSSKVRIVLLIQFLCGLAWAGWGWIAESQGDREMLMVLSVMGAVYWTFVGAFLIAEPGGLSRRVTRQIPRGRWSQALVAVLFPGPGTGLALVLIHLVLICAVVGLAELTETWAVINYRARGTRGAATAVVLAICSYAVFYLGLGTALVGFIRRFRPVPVIVGAAITYILCVAGVLIPTFFAMALRPRSFSHYAFWQITDPIATIYQLEKQPNLMSPFLLVPMALAAMAFLVNLPAAAREIFAFQCAARSGQRTLAPSEPVLVTVAEPLTAVTEPVRGV